MDEKAFASEGTTSVELVLFFGKQSKNRPKYYIKQLFAEIVHQVAQEP